MSYHFTQKKKKKKSESCSTDNLIHFKSGVISAWQGPHTAVIKSKRLSKIHCVKDEKNFILKCSLVPLFFGTSDKTEQKRQKISKT